MLTLVTGATGLVGNNVVRLLLERGQAVRVLARETSDPRPLEGLNVEIVRGDMRDPDAVAAAMRGVTHVVHAAALVRIGWRGLDEMRRVNVEGTRHVAQAARESGTRMVHVSTCDTLGEQSPDRPTDEETPGQGSVPVPYTVTKREAEQVIAAEVAAGLAASIVNPAFMLGPWDWKPSSGQMLLEVARGRGLFAPRGQLSVCDVRDVAAGTLAAVEAGEVGRRYILGGRTMPIIDLWREMADVAGARKPVRQLSRIVLKLAGASGDLWGSITGREPNVNSGAIAVAASPKSYSSARAQGELGYQIRPLRETLEDACQWFRDEGYL